MPGSSALTDTDDRVSVVRSARNAPIFVRGVIRVGRRSTDAPASIRSQARARFFWISRAARFSPPHVSVPKVTPRPERTRAADARHT